MTELTASHWGAYEWSLDANGADMLRPYGGDPDPSPIGLSMMDAYRSGTRVIVPSGAVAGLDMLRAAAIGRIRSVRLRTRKPPAGLDAGGDGPTCVFAGNAIEACRAFPRNVNVAATLSLAGIGGERTEVEIWSDPALARNVHEIEIDAEDTLIRMSIENRPSATNPRSSAITAHSVCAVLAGLVDPVRIGT